MIREPPEQALAVLVPGTTQGFLKTMKWSRDIEQGPQIGDAFFPGEGPERKVPGLWSGVLIQLGKHQVVMEDYTQFLMSRNVSMRLSINLMVP